MSRSGASGGGARGGLRGRDRGELKLVGGISCRVEGELNEVLIRYSHRGWSRL